MYDLHDWFLMPSAKAGYKLANGQVYGRETHHLEGFALDGSKVMSYHHDTGRTLIFTKSQQGWPHDLKSYDSQGIRDWVTELDWESLRDYKAFNPPLLMCPRYWDGDESAVIVHSTSPYDVVTNCAKTGSGNVQEVVYTLHGPFSCDYQGDVGEAVTILLTYYWGNGMNREQLFLTQAAGWVKWTHATKLVTTSGIVAYTLDSVSNHNKIVAGQVTPQFPCMAIP